MQWQKDHVSNDSIILKKIQRESGLTNREISLLLHVPEQILDLIEAGDRNLTLESKARAYDCLCAIEVEDEKFKNHTI